MGGGGSQAPGNGSWGGDGQTTVASLSVSCVQFFILKPLVSGTRTHFPCPRLPLTVFESCPQS